MNGGNSTRAISIIAGLAFSLAWLTACSGGSGSPDPEVEPVVPETQKSILFSGAVDNSKAQTTGTRATKLSDYVQTFRVYGYKNTAYDSGTGSYDGLLTVFDNYLVNYLSTSAGSTLSNRYGWEYVNGTTQTIHYWDYSATAYRFAAYAPAAGVTVTNPDADHLKFAFQVDGTSNDLIYYSQLWFSDNSPSYTAYGQPVVLTFVPPLCKVRICFINGEGNAVTTDDLVYLQTDRTSIQFKPTDGTALAQKGSFAVTYPLTGAGTTETVEVMPETNTADGLEAITEPYEEADKLAFAYSTQRWYTLLPMATQGTYTLSLTYNGSPRTAVVPAEYMSWKPGYEYTYVFKLTDMGVVFEPELYVYTKWQVGYTQTTTW